MPQTHEQNIPKSARCHDSRIVSVYLTNRVDLLYGHNNIQRWIFNNNQARIPPSPPIILLHVVLVLVEGLVININQCLASDKRGSHTMETRWSNIISAFCKLEYSPGKKKRYRQRIPPFHDGKQKGNHNLCETIVVSNIKREVEVDVRTCFNSRCKQGRRMTGLVICYYHVHVLRQSWSNDDSRRLIIWWLRAMLSVLEAWQLFTNTVWLRRGVRCGVWRDKTTWGKNSHPNAWSVTRDTRSGKKLDAPLFSEYFEFPSCSIVLCTTTI
jgi:hypothetical protein